MPRRERVQKNPYLKRSRLDKRQFEALVYYYFAEVLHSYSRDECRMRFTVTIGGAKGQRIKILTRQSIGRYFERISQYIWDICIADRFQPFLEKNAFDDLLGLIYGKKQKLSSHRKLYEAFEFLDMNGNADNITNTFFFFLLSERSKAIRGFKKDKFYLEFSRVFFICLAIYTSDFKFQSIYSATELCFLTTEIENYSEIAAISTAGLLNFMKERPM